MIEPIFKGESKIFNAILSLDGTKLSKSELDAADDLVFVAKKDITLADGAAGTIPGTSQRGPEDVAGQARPGPGRTGSLE